MTGKIDIWQDWGDAEDQRGDRDRNAKGLNIVFQGGTFGNFLKFMLDKFSKLSPDIDVNPFTKIGTSHDTRQIKFSGLIQRYHQSFINDNKGLTGLPVCIILPSTEKHFLFLKKAQWFRPLDAKASPDDLWKKAVGEMPYMVKEQVEILIKQYEIKELAHFSWIPKFIVRDWYKLEFLQDIKETYNYKWFKQFERDDFFAQQNVFHFDLEGFFNWDTFLMNIKKLDEAYGLELDYGRQDEMKKLFDEGYELDNIRKECNMVEEVLELGTDIPLTGLDVATEAYLYAHFEKQYPDIQMPLTNRFFRDYQEIQQFLEHFPAWYRRPNPNIK